MFVLGYVYYFLTVKDLSDDRILRELLPGGKLVTIHMGELTDIKHNDGQPNAYNLRGVERTYEDIRTLYATSSEAAEAQRLLIQEYKQADAAESARQTLEQGAPMDGTSKDEKVTASPHPV